MTKHEIEAAFRGAVTATLNNDSPSIAFPENMTVDELVQFAGLGVTMTNNLLGLWAMTINADPQEAWEWLIQKGAEMGLSGLAP